MTRGFFAIGVYHPKHSVNVGSVWRTACSYGAAMVFTVGSRYRRQASDTFNTPALLPLVHFADVDDLHAHLPHGCPLIGVELDPRATPLGAYSHLRQAAYLLGAEDHGLPPSVIDRCHGLVQIETPTRWSLNVAVAAGILLRDRHVRAADRGVVEAVTS